MSRIFFISILVLFLSSCASDLGHQVQGDNLTVFFTDKKDEGLATKLAVYLKDRKMLSGEKQDLQLIKEGKTHYLKMIANEPEVVKQMPFEERSLLLKFQKELQDSIFTNTSLELIICDSKFESIYDINQ